jgi:dihydroflavonol-4-reductase
MGTRVMVTGANGHLGHNLATDLHQRGYDVRASVRDAADPDKAGRLRLAGVDDIVSLDVTDGDRFHEAVGGVEILFHVAATYQYWTPGPDADAQMVRDSVEGATNAVRAAAAQGVRRLVLTSSTVTLPLARTPDAKVDETTWRTDLRVPYFRAKTEAEQAAWALAEDLGVTMVAILPGGILGPGFTRGTPSTDLVENIMRGGYRTGVPPTNFPAVDVRDVVRGHVLAAEAEVTGRIAVINDVSPTLADLVRVMRGIDPRVPRSWMTLPAAAMSAGPFFDAVNARLLGTKRMLSDEFVGSMKGLWWAVSNERAARELGWRPEITLEQSLADTMSTLRALGV